MLRPMLALLLLALLSTLAPPAAASHGPPCSLFSLYPTTTPGGSVTVPLPGTVGPATVGGQSVGGQTVGPVTVPGVTLPVLARIEGVPVVGTLTVGGPVTDPRTVPAQTLPVANVPQHTVGPVVTGLDPLVVTVFPQTIPASLHEECVGEAVEEQGDHVATYLVCIDEDTLIETATALVRCPLPT